MKGFTYVQCPHCQYFMSIYIPIGVDFLSYSCANLNCKKGFDARLKITYVLEIEKYLE